MKNSIVVAAVVLALSISGVAQANGGHTTVTKTKTVSKTVTAVKTASVAKTVIAAKTIAVAKPGIVKKTIVPTTYYRSNGVRFSGGYYFVGRNQPHWSVTKFSPVYNTTIYLDPGLNVWYYWSAPAGRFYPVTSRR